MKISEILVEIFMVPMRKWLINHAKMFFGNVKLMLNVKKNILKDFL